MPFLVNANSSKYVLVGAGPDLGLSTVVDVTVSQAGGTWQDQMSTHCDDIHAAGHCTDLQYNAGERSHGHV